MYLVLSYHLFVIQRRTQMVDWTEHPRHLLLVLIIIAGASPFFPVGIRTAQAADDTHVVRPGESLASIARQYNVSLGDLSAHNGVTDPDFIWVGQQIAIPLATAVDATTTSSAITSPTTVAQLPGGDGYYVVQRGDSLSQIAKSYDMSLADMLRLNGLDNPNTIFVGQRLRLSARVTPMEVSTQSEPELADAIYVVKDGDTLVRVARKFDTTMEDLIIINGLPNANFVWTGQRLRIKTAPAPARLSTVGAPAYGKRLIEVDLSDQTLTAWQGDVPVLHTIVSTGKITTPTVLGRFDIGAKYESQDMFGDDFDLPNVPWVMYFYDDFAIHGAYWHSDFGLPVSHGCVNMIIDQAKDLYDWAPMGTEVYLHE